MSTRETLTRRMSAGVELRNEGYSCTDNSMSDY